MYHQILILAGGSHIRPSGSFLASLVKLKNEKTEQTKALGPRLTPSSFSPGHFLHSWGNAGDESVWGNYLIYTALNIWSHGQIGRIQKETLIPIRSFRRSLTCRNDQSWRRRSRQRWDLWGGQSHKHLANIISFKWKWTRGMPCVDGQSVCVPWAQCKETTNNC